MAKITRSNDYSGLDNKTFNKLAKQINNINEENLVDIVENEKEAKILKKELSLEGYNTKIKPHNNKFKVIAVKNNDQIKIDYRKAKQSNCFEKVAWGRYCFQRKNNNNDFSDYNFDDGSIWKVEEDEEDNKYLVKELNNDGDIIRAADNNIKSVVNKDNLKNVLSLLYDIDNINNTLVKDLLNNIGDQFYSMLNNKISSLIDNQLEKNYNIESNAIKNNVKGLITQAINKKEIKNKKHFQQFINKSVENQESLTNKPNKIFNQ
jgi:hypothetical protein